MRQLTPQLTTAWGVDELEAKLLLQWADSVQSPWVDIRLAPIRLADFIALVEAQKTEK